MSQHSINQPQKTIILNKYSEKLVGLLHDTGSREVVIVCHGFSARKEHNIVVNICNALEKEGISVYHFDFSGNGESDGLFAVGNYMKEVEGMRAVVEYFNGANRYVSAIVGHSKGKVLYRVTEESLMERLNTDMHETALKIDQNCRVLTVHGSADETIPVEDAHEFSKIISNHKLHIVEGANHSYTEHLDELVPVVIDFIISCIQHDKESSG